MEKYLPPPGPPPVLTAEEEERRRSLDITATPPGPRGGAAPWLVFPTGKYGKNQTFYNLLLCEQQPPHNQKLSIPELSGTSYYQYGSHQGWLIIIFDEPDYHYSISQFGDCILWNPQSFETIQLPNMLQFIQKKSKVIFHGFVLTSPPTNSDSMVCFIYEKCNDLVFTRPLIDKQWRTHRLPIDYKKYLLPPSMFCFKGKLHIPCYYNLHLVVQTKFHLRDEDDETLSVTQFQVSLDNDFESPLGGIVRGIETSYVESSGELFKVIRFFQAYDASEVRDLKVFKMDFNVMEWEQVHSLGDHILFVGTSTTASCSSTDLGLPRGCVYYTQYQRNMLFKFDLECKTISVSFPCSNLATPWYAPDWISMPTNFRVAEERRKAKISCNNTKLGGNAGINLNYDICENRGELKQTGAWASFNENVIGLIASYLRPVDYLNFRAACRENRSALPATKWKIMSSIETLNGTLPPWLVFSRKNDDIYYFTDPMHNSDRFLMNLSEFLLDSTIRFSKGGWLLMSRKEKSMFFFNPFTREIIPLPDFPDMYGYVFHGISFSSLPTASDCKIFAINGFDRYGVYIFTISRGDDAWRHGQLRNSMLPSNGKVMDFFASSNNPVFYDGKFYCLDRYGTLGVFYPESFVWEVLAKPKNHVSLFISRTWWSVNKSSYPCLLVKMENVFEFLD